MTASDDDGGERLPPRKQAPETQDSVVTYGNDGDPCPRPRCDTSAVESTSRIFPLRPFILSLVAVATFLSACTLGRVNTRVTYWTTETHAHLPVGTSLDDAQRFFATRGLSMRCCVSGPPGASRYYFATDRRVGRFIFTEYDVAVLISFTSDERVESVRVERWGVGL